MSVIKTDMFFCLTVQISIFALPNLAYFYTANIRKIKCKTKFNIKILFFFAVIILVSCAEVEINKEEFGDIYKEILITREIEPDSLEANRKVEEILENNGYTEERFRKTFLKLSEDRKEFVKFLSDIRAKAETTADSLKKIRYTERVKKK